MDQGGFDHVQRAPRIDVGDHAPFRHVRLFGGKTNQAFDCFFAAAINEPVPKQLENREAGKVMAELYSDGGVARFYNHIYGERRSARSNGWIESVNAANAQA